MEYPDTVCESPNTVTILNIPRRTCVHTFSSSKLLTTEEQRGSAAPSHSITALTQSPAIDVIGVGFASGEISVHDIREDERLMKMYMKGGGVRALSFRSGRCCDSAQCVSLMRNIRRPPSPSICVVIGPFGTLGLEFQRSPAPSSPRST